MNKSTKNYHEARKNGLCTSCGKPAKKDKFGRIYARCQKCINRERKNAFERKYNTHPEKRKGSARRLVYDDEPVEMIDKDPIC